MEIYVDKLPESCRECDFNSEHTGTCNAEFNYLICSEFSTTERHTTCPLKELTNAQLAIGWYQEGKEVISTELNKHLVYREICTQSRLETLFNWTWRIKEELTNTQFTYTDWKGAREAFKQGKKVTIFSHDAECVLELHCTMFHAYIIKDIENSSYFIDDEYDSTEWKVWS